MKKINTLFVILFAAMAFCGCGNSSQEAQVKKPDSIQQKEQKNKTSDLFEVKDGVLIRYKGSYQTERKIILPESVKVIGKKAFSLSEKENWGLSLNGADHDALHKVLLDEGVHTDDGHGGRAFEGDACRRPKNGRKECFSRHGEIWKRFGSNPGEQYKSY